MYLFDKTLNLPKTDFPMKANLSCIEKDILLFWETIKLYTLLQSVKSKNNVFVLNDGPPYANGPIHLGHGLNKVLKDIVNKVKLLFGCSIAYIPGWDCHGLPIELSVEKQIGKPKTEIEKINFMKFCRVFVKQQIEVQKSAFKRLGILADWENSYTTMDFCYEANVVRLISKFLSRGDLVKYNKPVYWCTECGSSLAEAEVIYKSKVSSSVFVMFKFVDQLLLMKSLNIFLDKSFFFSVVVWTTTPWTLVFNKAVAVSASFFYVCLLVNKNVYVVAELLVDSFINNIGNVNFSVLLKVKGDFFIHFFVYDPLYKTSVPIVLSDHVTLTVGTGFVHIAPSYGYEDYLVSLKYKLPSDIAFIDSFGKYCGDDKMFHQVTVVEMSGLVINLLRKNENLIFCSDYNHSYPHCWRHKFPLIFRSTVQWFISMSNNDLLNKSLIALNNIMCNVPKWGIEYFFSILKVRPDWCISRQRIWGIPLALCVHKTTGELHTDSVKILNRSADIIEKIGIEGWCEISKDSFLIENNISCSNEYMIINDVLDVWFDSAAVFFCVLLNGNFCFPADLCIEGFDQYRGWFQSSLLVSVATQNVAPYKEIISHGFVVDKDGIKLSKSLSNSISPLSIVNIYGADIFRLWVSSVNFSVDVFISDEILERLCDVYRKIRNTIRFLISNLKNFDLVGTVNFFPENLLKIDLWLLNNLFFFQQRCIQFYEQYDFTAVYQFLINFCNKCLSSFYFDIIKDRLYTSRQDCFIRKSAQFSLYYVYLVLIHVISPILSFTAEEAWVYNTCSTMVNKLNTIFLSTWVYDILNPYFLVESVARKSFSFLWDFFFYLRNFVYKLLDYYIRYKVISTSTQAELIFFCGSLLYKQLVLYKYELCYFFCVSKVYLFSVVHFDFPLIIDKNFLINDDAFIVVKKTKSVKCLRCWSVVLSLNYFTDDYLLCNRCIANLDISIEVDWEGRKFF